MIFYLALDENGRRQIRGTQADARAINKNFEQIDIPTSKQELMEFVQELYKEIDLLHGSLDERVVVEDDRPPPAFEDKPPMTTAERSGYTEQSVKWDELFPTLPLAHQLHFATMALENARERL